MIIAKWIPSNEMIAQWERDPGKKAFPPRIDGDYEKE
jgi:hypothetical protein